MLMAVLICLASSRNLDAAQTPFWPMPPVTWFVERLPAPPESHSKSDLADLRHSVNRQSTSSANDFNRAIHSNDFSLFTFDRSLGRRFQREDFPLTAKLFADVESSVDSVTSQLKRFYKRERLEVVHPGKVKLFVTRAPGYSYPSGHTARAKVFGLLLAELAPSKRYTLLAQAREIGDDRVLSGQHYRSDVDAGWIVGSLVFHKLMADSSFLKFLRHVKKNEWTPRASSLH